MPAEARFRLPPGVHVLVTRPAHQGAALCAMIERAGGHAVSLPALEIAAPADAAPVERVLERLETFDIAVFISANAVAGGLAFVTARRAWPPGVRIAVVGRSSAECLADYGLRADICPPSDFSSEGLLAMEPMRRISGKRVVIFRGEGGREVLANVLRARGAEVTYAEVYRRVLPAGGAERLRELARSQPIDLIVVTSNEGLQNFCTMAGDDLREWLLQKPLVVMSGRTAELAHQLGFRGAVRVAGEQSDRGLLRAIEAWGGPPRRVIDSEQEHAERQKENP